MFNISPKIGMNFNLLLGLIIAIGSGKVGLPPGVDAAMAQNIVAWAAWIGVVANFLMHGYSAPTSGPLAGVSPANVNSPWMVGAMALVVSAAVALTGCSALQVTQASNNAIQLAGSITAVNNALIQLDTTVISNTAQLANALLKINCPITNNLVSLGKAVAADPNVADSVKKKLIAAGPAGALQAEVCIAAGLGPTSATAPATAVVTGS